jgi:hypothetical protein
MGSGILKYTYIKMVFSHLEVVCVLRRPGDGLFRPGGCLFRPGRGL